MIHLVFLAAGVLSGIHLFTYGRWLQKRGNLPGAILAYVFTAAAAALPAWHIVFR